VKLEGAIRSGEARRIVKRNRELMDLRAAADSYADLEPLSRHGTWDEEGFARWLREQRVPRLELAGLNRAFEAMAVARA